MTWPVKGIGVGFARFPLVGIKLGIQGLMVFYGLLPRHLLERVTLRTGSRISRRRLGGMGGLIRMRAG